MQSFASAIDEPMLFQIRDELPNLARHTKNIIKTTTSKFCEICQEKVERPLSMPCRNFYSFTTSICLSITCPVKRSIATWTQ